MAETLRTPVGMSSFVHLFTPRAPTQGAEPRFSMNILFDQDAQNSPEYKKLKVAVSACVKDQWGDKIPSGLRSPFRDAGEKDYEGYTPGTIYIAPWSKQKPGIVDGRLQDVLAADDVFAGQLVRATIRAFAYDNSGNRGVSFGLQNVQIVKAEMPRLDGKKAASKDFDALDDLDALDSADGSDDGDLVDPFDS